MVAGIINSVACRRPRGALRLHLASGQSGGRVATCGIWQLNAPTQTASDALEPQPVSYGRVLLGPLLHREPVLPLLLYKPSHRWPQP